MRSAGRPATAAAAALTMKTVKTVITRGAPWSVRCGDIRMHLPNIVVNTVDHVVFHDVDYAAWITI
jgi:hypothetical protein